MEREEIEKGKAIYAFKVIPINSMKPMAIYAHKVIPVNSMKAMAISNEIK